MFISLEMKEINESYRRKFFKPHPPIFFFYVSNIQVGSALLSIPSQLVNVTMNWTSCPYSLEMYTVSSEFLLFVKKALATDKSLHSQL